MAVAETVNADLIYTEPSETGRYEGHYDRLRLAALSYSNSLKLLSKVANQLTE
jgi:hypothetical protein